MRMNQIQSNLAILAVDLIDKVSVDNALMLLTKTAQEYLDCEVVNIYFKDFVKKQVILKRSSQEDKDGNHDQRRKYIVGFGDVGKVAESGKLINRNFDEDLEGDGIEGPIDFSSLNPQKKLFGRSRKIGAVSNTETSANILLLKGAGKTGAAEELESSRMRKINTVLAVPIINVSGSIEGKLKTETLFYAQFSQI